MRSRIHENFTEEDLDFLHSICYHGHFDNNNDKADAILSRFYNKGFIELAPATNRYAMLKGDYVYKFALDSAGVTDNWNEFNMSLRLQPYATRTYESNGYIAIAEYVNLMKKEPFMDSKENIRAILKVLSEDFIFGDVGTLSKNYCNWGYRDNDELVILDYGYFYEKDRKIMFCPKCGGALQYDINYDRLECARCQTKVTIADIHDRMLCSEDSFVKGDKPYVVKIL